MHQNFASAGTQNYSALGPDFAADLGPTDSLTPMDLVLLCLVFPAYLACLACLVGPAYRTGPPCWISHEGLAGPCLLAESQMDLSLTFPCCSGHLVGCSLTQIDYCSHSWVGIQNAG